jgi:4-diphosphocytidyl-2-C-methyl-D-erythritol kinase
MHIIKPRAKINLFFQITGKRNDGYHMMESLVVFADDVYDSVEIAESEVNSTSIEGGEFGFLLVNEKNNLIDKALEIFAKDIKYHCKLTKNIPIGAGLGGGSSDAAMVAKYLSKDNITQELLEIGADLPICYHDAPAFCSGIGEIVEPIKNFPKVYMVLVNPNQTLLTKDVFKINTKINTPSIQNKPIDFFCDIEKLIEFISPLSNDLTESATQLMPEIQDILDLIQSQNGCAISRMSGSGPTCFGVFRTKESALKAESSIKNLYSNYWVKYSGV